MEERIVFFGLTTLLKTRPPVDQRGRENLRAGYNAFAGPAPPLPSPSPPPLLPWSEGPKTKGVLGPSGEEGRRLLLLPPKNPKPPPKPPPKTTSQNGRDPHLANTTFGHPQLASFGQSYLAEFGQFCLTEFGQTAFGQFFFVGLVGGLSGGRVRRWEGRVLGARRVRGPKFRAFFSLPPEISPGRSSVHVWTLWLSCETPAASDRPSQDRPKFCSFFPLAPQFTLFVSLSGCLLVEFWCCLKRRGALNTTKIPREDPPKREERMKFLAGERKKRAKFWAVRRRGRSVEGRSRGGGGPGEGKF